ncbi:MAG: cytochrome c oxidase assembly protein [Pelagibacterales bacterium]|jgi:cytochrome c oxidase assembly protein subunit 11|nr:cytochrome c oxidase assembly protein [Pelagibacterales bacterium]MBT4109364.1 cytochrome c oxidase assembly protein [Pelagibacterales bacterium]MBT7077417.1 cytochrome c oxidase assembly protein [Pelagibacterales bacterium]
MKKNNTKFTAILVISIVAGMIGLSYAAVPLYDLFCRTTGFGGTPVAFKEENKETNIPKINIKVQFNSDVAGGMNWKFMPVQREVVVQTGTNNLAFYQAKNLSDTKITGVATFNVTPPKIGKYFSKIDCFCFEEQTLESGEIAEMPVSFFIDPEIAMDPNTEEVKTITLSYTFFNSGEKNENKGKINKNSSAQIK